MNGVCGPWSRFRLFCAASAVSLACLLSLGAPTNSRQQTPGGAAVGIRTFATPEQAVDALIDAAAKFDVTALESLFGPDGREIINTGEPVRDREQALAFAAQAREKRSLEVDPRDPRRAFLSVGREDWPFPVPLVKRRGQWSFDARAGRQEILYRRIGRNELDVIQICRGYVEAQHEYALTKRDGSGVNQYAQRIISQPGRQDGLAWQNADGTWGGPVGENVARAVDRGYRLGADPFHGYYFKVLKGQGPAAPLGRLDFVVKGAMIGGFALIAFPAQYRITGVKTFMVSHDGVVYQKDLGSKTPEIAGSTERYNPDQTWSPVPGQ
ncbi:MAG TPA: DUF2950 domain-containing protein [Blastocatellia bacterium]|nr:DUF2950 domain-containing protein [Blastocatellia bacterium]